MSSGHRRRLTAAASVAGGVLLAAVGGWVPIASAKPANKLPALAVGFTAPLSGPYGAIGEIYLNGMKAEATLLNAAGGVQGHKIKVIGLDDAGTPTRATTAAQQLIQQDHVKFMVPGILPQEITAVLPYTTAAKVLTIVGQGATTVVSPKWPYEFQYDLPYTTYAAAAVAAFKLRHLSVTKVAVIDTSTGSPTAVFAAYDKLSKYGIHVVDTETFAATATTVTPQVSKMQSAGAQVIITATGGSTLSTLFKAISALHITLPVLGSVATTTSTPLETLIPAANQSQFFATTYGILAHSAKGLSATMTKWVSTVKRFGPLTSLLVACNGADQLKLAVWAYRKAGYKATGAKAAKELGKTSKLTFPKGFLFNETNPKWTSKNHSDGTADTSSSWAMVTVGPNLDGTYPGAPLTLAKAK